MVFLVGLITLLIGAGVWGAAHPKVDLRFRTGYKNNETVNGSLAVKGVVIGLVGAGITVLGWFLLPEFFPATSAARPDAARPVIVDMAAALDLQRPGRHRHKAKRVPEPGPTIHEGEAERTTEGVPLDPYE